MGDSTIDGAISNAIESKVNDLQNITNKQQYRQKLVEIKSLYLQSTLHLRLYPHLIKEVDSQIQIIDSTKKQPSGPQK